jgi:hypothetical protein
VSRDRIPLLEDFEYCRDKVRISISPWSIRVPYAATLNLCGDYKPMMFAVVKRKNVLRKKFSPHFGRIRLST